MSCTFTPVWFLLGFLLFAGAAALQKDTSKSIRLNAVNPEFVQPDSAPLNIQCTFDISRTNLVKVVELSISRLDIGGNGEKEMMAEVSPANLTYGLSQSDISASGQIKNDAKSTLFVSYVSNTDGYCKTYSCLAKGFKANGQEASIFRPIKVKGVNGSLCKSKLPAKVPVYTSEERNAECCVSSEALQAQNKSIESLEVEVQKCSAVIPEVSDNRIDIEELHEEVSNLSTALNNIENVTSDLVVDVREKLNKFSKSIRKLDFHINYLLVQSRGLLRVLTIDVTRFYVSNILGNSVYSVSKSERALNLRSMNAICRLTGGFVLEFEHLGEQFFVADFIKSLGPGEYYIGANDVETEGTFVYYNSGKPVTNVLWAEGEPKSSGENEDCVQLTRSGLKNVSCGRVAKVICKTRLFSQKK
ncbi:collectin-11 [Plakobranchus ocellatus]|uniref:Collectin-11 n=1 Tax=Plakobranchus ocellatus TaxID=259542 RepID=A0AAV4AET0_9GAST|nr:collectin-11 [Plakobranchus ocellatus]